MATQRERNRPAAARQPIAGASGQIELREVSEAHEDYVADVADVAMSLAQHLGSTGAAGPGAEHRAVASPGVFVALRSRRALATDLRKTVRRVGGLHVRSLVRGEACAVVGALADLADVRGLTTIEPCRLGAIRAPSALGCLAVLCDHWDQVMRGVPGHERLVDELYIDQGQGADVRMRAIEEVRRLIALKAKLGKGEKRKRKKPTTAQERRDRLVRNNATLLRSDQKASVIVAELKGKGVTIDKRSLPRWRKRLAELGKRTR